jgi:di/tripeptidase
MSTTLKDKLEKIKGAFDVLAAKFNAAEPIPTPTPEPIPAKMATDYKTLDGQTVLSISELVVGGDVMIGETAAPDGEYTLDNNTIVQVAAGKIVELSSLVEDTMPEEMKKMQDTITKMSSQIAALETALTTQKQNFSASIANNKDLMELVVELSEKSIVAPVEKVVDYSKLSPLQKFRLSKQN